MKKKKSKIKYFFVLLVFIIQIAILMFLLIPGIKKKVTIEAGNTMLSISDFLLWNNTKCTAITNFETIDYSKAGQVEILFQYKNKIYKSILNIVDTSPPYVKTKEYHAILNDQRPNPMDFIEQIYDFSNTVAYYKNKPDLNYYGKQKVEIIVEDRYLNQTEVESYLKIYDIKKEIVVELGSKQKIEGEDFLNNTNHSIEIISDLNKIMKKQVGEYSVELLVDDDTFFSSIKIVDTTPPKASIKHLQTFKDIYINPEDFIYNIKDFSPVTIKYKDDVNFNILGRQEVSLLLTDISGNESIYKAELEILEDTEPPLIEGVKDQVVYVGSTILYKKDVKVTDNSNEDIELKIDNINVNLKQPGKYKVIYSAKDRAGNISTVESEITVVELLVTKEVLDEMVTDIINKITNDNMTKKEKAYEVFKWTKNHIAYTGFSDKTDWHNEAYRGIKNAKGDCFTYFSVSKALLDKIEVENREVRRIGGRTNHYWHLVYIDDGWYHFDSTRNSDGKTTFMMTTADVEKLSKSRGRSYYNFDKDLYLDIQIE